MKRTIIAWQNNRQPFRYGWGNVKIKLNEGVELISSWDPWFKPQSLVGRTDGAVRPVGGHSIATLNMRGTPTVKKVEWTA
jgi:hypothetical protein